MNEATTFGGTIKRGFASLLLFSGRDRRSQFWPFALAVFLILNALSVAILAPVMVKEIIGSIATAERLSQENPQDWAVERSGGSVNYRYIGDDPAVLQAMLPDFGLLFVVTAVLSLAFVVVMAAAVTRRLHDRGHSGLWQLVPALLLAASYWQMSGFFSEIMAGRVAQDDAGAIMQGMGALFGLNMLYSFCSLLLLVQLALIGQPQANRYGAPPA